MKKFSCPKCKDTHAVTQSFEYYLHEQYIGAYEDGSPDYYQVKNSECLAFGINDRNCRCLSCDYVGFVEDFGLERTQGLIAKIDELEHEIASLRGKTCAK